MKALFQTILEGLGVSFPETPKPAKKHVKNMRHKKDKAFRNKVQSRKEKINILKVYFEYPIKQPSGKEAKF